MSYLSLSDDGTKSFSRDGQDKFIIHNIFHEKKNGYFLDIGASNGISENNTYLFEKYYGWKGICCEPDPRDVMELCKNRTCHIVNCPIYKTTGALINFELHWANHLSGISGYQLENYRSIDSDIIHMTTLSLTDCLKRLNAPTAIDYMSLDTEGSEYEILSTFDFDTYKISYIGLEHNFQEPKRANIKNLLLSKGYVYHRSVAHDDDYVLKDFAIKNNIKF